MPRRSTLLVIAILAIAQALAWRTGSAGSGGPPSVDTGQVPMRLGDWQGQDLEPLDDLSRQMLQPDAVISRAYQDPAGNGAELLVVYGHRKVTFHSPGQCLLGGGWSIVSKQRRAMAAGDGRIEVNRFLIQNDGHRAVVLYGYGEGGRFTPSWLTHQLYLASARARDRAPRGALVRIIVPVAGDEAAADEVGMGFARAALPSILRSLQGHGEP